MVQSSTAVSLTLWAALLRVYPRLQLPSTPITAEVAGASLCRTVSWPAASAATLQVDEAPLLEERVGTVMCTAGHESVTTFMTVEFARLGPVDLMSPPLGRGKRRASQGYSPSRRHRCHSRLSASVMED